MNDEIKQKEITSIGVKFYIMPGTEVARAYLYILKNDLHVQPFGFMEDVFVNPNKRNAGVGSRLVTAVIEEARSRGCYKLVCTSRHSKPEVHKFYQKLGFKNQGIEFRINLNRKC